MNNRPYKRNEAALILSALLASPELSGSPIESAIVMAQEFDEAHRENAPYPYLLLPEVTAVETVGRFRSAGSELYFYNGETETYIGNFKNQMQSVALAIALNTMMGDSCEREETVEVNFRFPYATEVAAVEIPKSLATGSTQDIMLYLSQHMEAVDARASDD